MFEAWIEDAGSGGAGAQPGFCQVRGHLQLARSRLSLRCEQRYAGSISWVRPVSQYPNRPINSLRTRSKVTKRPRGALKTGLGATCAPTSWTTPTARKARVLESACLLLAGDLMSRPVSVVTDYIRVSSRQDNIHLLTEVKSMSIFDIYYGID